MRFYNKIIQAEREEKATRFKGKVAAWVTTLLLMVAACSEMNVSEQAVAHTDESALAGKELFITRCSGCHLVNKELTGPALAGVRERWKDSALLYAFIRNSDSVIALNAYARDLYLRYNQTPMQKHDDLSEGEITAILNYIDKTTVSK